MKEPKFHFMNLLRHNIDVDEADEALRDGWNRRRRDGDNYEVLGRTGDGRYLQLIVEIQPDCIWVFHANDMNDSERRRYRRK